MKYRTRTFYTSEQRALMWDRYQQGDSLNTIARMFDRGHSAVAGNIGRSGGIRPADRKRRESSLTLDEREEISRGFVAGVSIRQIAKCLDRAPSTISREISRNEPRKEFLSCSIQVLKRMQANKGQQSRQCTQC